LGHKGRHPSWRLVSKFDADQELKKWMQQNNIRVLNVAGPRAFKEPEVAQSVISTLGHAFNDDQAP
jgi:antibiotic biosynthesis monooxygenase (ABM) superfamily enzyme